MKKGLCLLTVTVLLACSSCGVVVEEHMPGETVTSPEETAEPSEATPQDDFYRYVNEETLANAEFSYGAMSAADGLDQEIVEEQLRELIGGIVDGSGYEAGTEEYIIKNVYDQYMAYHSGAAPQELKDLIRQIDSVSTIDGLMAEDAMLMREYGVPGILNNDVEGDAYVPGRNSIVFIQYGSLMNVPFDDLQHYTYGLSASREVVKSAMMVAGYEPSEAERIGTDMAYLVLDICRGSGDIILDDPDIYKYVTSCTADDLRSIFTSFDIDAYMAALGLTSEQYSYSMVMDMEQLSTINSILTEDNLEALKAWKITSLVQTYMQFFTMNLRIRWPDITGRILRTRRSGLLWR